MTFDPDNAASGFGPAPCRATSDDISKLPQILGQGGNFNQVRVIMYTVYIHVFFQIKYFLYLFFAQDIDLILLFNEIKFLLKFSLKFSLKLRAFYSKFNILLILLQVTTLHGERRNIYK